MVYLKPLYSSQFSAEAQQEHVKILFFKMLYIFIKKVQDWKILSLYDITISA